MDNAESLKRAPDGAGSGEEPGTSIRAFTHVFLTFLGKLALVGVATAVLLFVFLMVTFNMPPFDLDKLEQLKPGMTKEEVTLVLGTPTHEMNDQWTYAGWGWPMVHIYFSADPRYESSDYDY